MKRNRVWIGALVAGAALSGLPAWGAPPLPIPPSVLKDVERSARGEGPASVSGAPNLPAGFSKTFTSRFVDTGTHWQHAVIGGDGPPLLLVHGWPENWYAWRLLMPGLAKSFEVIAVDQRGIGLSDKPQDGYDCGTLAADLVALMDQLGHRQFAVEAAGAIKRYRACQNGNLVA